MAVTLSSLRRAVVQVHKWVGIGIGLVVLMWLVTGLVMIQPQVNALPPVTNDFSAAAVSPAEAIGHAGLGDSSDAGVRRVALQTLGSRLVYQVFPRRGPPVLVDASDGSIVVVTEDLVRQVATELFGDGSVVGEVERITRHDAGYPFGPLPVLRAAIASGDGVLLHLSERDATVRASSSQGRVIAAFGRWHTFRALGAIHPSKRFEHGMLWLTSLLAIGLAVTGYLISFKWRRRRQAR